jgi:hypothetical protein
VGGSGYIARIAREFNLVAQRALQHLNHPNCETACYRCLKSYQNQRHHEKLRWPAVIGDLEQLAESAPQSVSLEQADSQDPRPWLEAFAAGVGFVAQLEFARFQRVDVKRAQSRISASSPSLTPPVSGRSPLHPLALRVGAPTCLFHVAYAYAT